MSRKIPLKVLTEKTQADSGNSLYVSESKVYPRSVSGYLSRLRVAAVFWLLGMYYLFAWLRWDGRQAVLFDLPARKFHVFGLIFWPQDFLFLSMLLMIAAFALFFFTALAGRLFCGYACPQTVWTETFLWIEHWTEGERNKRIKLDAGPWNSEKWLRKGSKHVLWLLFALWTGFTFVGYFTPITDLGRRLFSFSWGGWETFWVLFYALATWGNAGFLREQVCKYMCPYARFQSAMFDRNTLIIAYDPMRGEPRGARKRGLASVLERARGLLDVKSALDYVFRACHHPSAATRTVGARSTITWDENLGVPQPLPKFKPEELGDCIDCTLCVQVCPTGIDIRNGLQYECIACGACIDACDEVMTKVGYQQGLIRYSTQNAIDGKPNHILRPRIIVYATLLVGFMLAWVVGVSLRSELIAEVLRDRNALYTQTTDGTIENGYTLKLANKSDEDRVYRIWIESSLDELSFQGSWPVLPVPSQQVISFPLIVQAPEGYVRGRHPIRFVVGSEDGKTRKEIESSFFGPVN